MCGADSSPLNTGPTATWASSLPNRLALVRSSGSTRSAARPAPLLAFAVFPQRGDQASVFLERIPNGSVSSVVSLLLSEYKADSSRFSAISPSFSAFPSSSTKSTSLSPTSWYLHSTVSAREEPIREHSSAPSPASSRSLTRCLKSCADCSPLADSVASLVTLLLSCTLLVICLLWSEISACSNSRPSSRSGCSKRPPSSILRRGLPSPGLSLLLRFQSSFFGVFPVLTRFGLC
jgi:hypothetical protein